MQNALDIFREITDTLLKDEVSNPVVEHIPTSDLFSKLDLSLQDKGISDEAFHAALKQVVLATPRTATTAFFNQLFGGRNDKAVLGDLLSVILNNSMYTYKAGGPQIGVEKVIIREICNIIGWDDQADGTMAPGGSMTNFMAMVMARDAYDESARSEGVSGKLIAYTSKESHYSVPKNAAFCGIGRKQVRYVTTDEYGCMDVSDLTEQIEDDIREGNKPMMVNCTAGTTVLGAFDPIRPVRELCDKYGMWLHMDGAYCGSVILSEKYKHLVDGVELLDSFSLNAHKMLSTPLSCSIIVVRNKKFLYDSFSNDASYLYQTDQDDYNPGKTSLQCGRRNDALKLWTLWKSVGTEGLENIVDHQFALADVARGYIRGNSDYELYSFDDSISICFNYKDIPARDICTALYEKSELLVGYGSYMDVEFIRLVTVNAQNKKSDILNFFEVMEKFVEKNPSMFSKYNLVEAG